MEEQNFEPSTPALIIWHCFDASSRFHGAALMLRRARLKIKAHPRMLTHVGNRMTVGSKAFVVTLEKRDDKGMRHPVRNNGRSLRALLCVSKMPLDTQGCKANCMRAHGEQP
ncbi:hypothetical protein KM043_013697 [Ampulex compressa]|nr:hypothetical protein KM043_013697 [Ampulex compressa]